MNPEITELHGVELPNGSYRVWGKCAPPKCTVTVCGVIEGQVQTDGEGNFSFEAKAVKHEHPPAYVQVNDGMGHNCPCNKIECVKPETRGKEGDEHQQQRTVSGSLPHPPEKEAHVEQHAHADHGFAADKGKTKK